MSHDLHKFEKESTSQNPLEIVSVPMEQL